MLALITPFIPFLLSLGLKIVAWFESDAAQKTANQNAFLALITSHVNDAQKSVNEKNSYQDEINQLQKGDSNDKGSK